MKGFCVVKPQVIQNVEKKKYLVTDGKRIWYSNTVLFDEASGILQLDDGRRAMVARPELFRAFVYNNEGVKNG